jgi:hypothetical protein
MKPSEEPSLTQADGHGHGHGHGVFILATSFKGK